MNFKVAVLTFTIPKGVSLAPLVTECGFSAPTLENPFAEKTLSNGAEIRIERQVIGAGDVDNVHAYIECEDLIDLTDTIYELANTSVLP